MRHFTIREMFLIVVIAAVSLGWWREHSIMSKASLRQRFEYQALCWEQWCRKNIYDSRFETRLAHDSVQQLSAMGSDIVPMIFERWTERKDPDNEPVAPPWWVVLERVTGKSMVPGAGATVRKVPLQGFPQSNPQPELQEQLWRQWWQNEGKEEYGAR